MDHIWRDARSVADLGEAMAGWLEDRIAARPGYNCNRQSRPDAETEHLVPVLARLNRSGWVTTDSQPGLDVTAFDGRPWVQCAAVQGWISAGNPLLNRVVREARAAGLVVTAYGAGRAEGPRDGRVATWWAGEPHTGFGGRPARFHGFSGLSGAPRAVRRELAREGVALAVIDPVQGRDDVLWPLLDGLCD